MRNLPFGGGGGCGCGGGFVALGGPGRRPGPGGGPGGGGPGATSPCSNVSHSPAYCDDGCCPVDGIPPPHYVPAPLDMTAQPVCTPL